MRIGQDELSAINEQVEACRAMLLMIAPMVLRSNGFTADFVREQGEQMAQAAGTLGLAEPAHHIPSQSMLDLFGAVALIMENASRDKRGEG